MRRRILYFCCVDNEVIRDRIYNSLELSRTDLDFDYCKSLKDVREIIYDSQNGNKPVGLLMAMRLRGEEQLEVAKLALCRGMKVAMEYRDSELEEEVKQTQAILIKPGDYWGVLELMAPREYSEKNRRRKEQHYQKGFSNGRK